MNTVIKKMNNRIIAIDPGATGAIAWSKIGEINVIKMPTEMTGMIDVLAALKEEQHNRAIIEQVGTYMPGNSGPSAAKFARHCGQIEAACYALNVATEYVLPLKWMSGMGITLPAKRKAPDELGKLRLEKWEKTEAARVKKERKNAIKQAMAQRYTHLKVTLVNADALGILTYAMRNEK